MTAPSYYSEFPTLSAAATVKNGKNEPSEKHGKQSFASQVHELSLPPPQSLTLTAVLQLLEPLENQQPDVYLMTRSYVQNWLIWAYHQKITKRESARVEEALRLAAQRLGLVPPQRDLEYEDPGPVDASIMSIEGHPLLLGPNVVVKDGGAMDSRQKVPAMLRRVKSLPDDADRKSGEEELDTSEKDTLDFDGNQLLCCAVPEQFYETLRAVHGVVCSDGFTIAFQPFQREADALLHHHSHSPQSGGENGTSNDFNGGRILPVPIEFRRRVLMKPAPKMEHLVQLANASSPMTKLLMEEEKRAPPRLVPWVEVYPIKLNYKVVSHDSGTDNSKATGFVLASRRSRVFDVLQSLLKVAAPQTSTTCRRLWTKRDNLGTKNRGDGYELVDLYGLDGAFIRKDESGIPAKPQLCVGDWIKTFGDAEIVKDIDVVVEIRRSNDSWPRESLEFENRLQVGDFCDAQDSAGKWYEALVREITEDTVKVHYFGWAQKWDATIRRRLDSTIEGPSAKMRPPAPLWTHCNRWRASITEGQSVEVRDTSSEVDRPKWYKGVVRRVGTSNGKPVPITGGAKLELFSVENGTNTNGTSSIQKPLLLLQMLQQIMVEVDKEKPSNPTTTVASIPVVSAAPSTDTVDALQPDPPHLRWVNLYGEEICQAGTHIRVAAEEEVGVVTLRYDYDTNRKPVEILKSWNNIYGQGFVKESIVGTPPAPGSVGMHNLGNSCYLNSIVQCLNHIEPLTQYFLTDEYSRHVNRRNPLGSGGRVATAYASLLREIWGGKYSALAPRMLKQTVASFAPQFNNSYQHDSQEFCQFLMDGLHEDCNRVEEKPYVEELEGFGMEDEKAAIETWRKHLLRHDSIIVDHFQGMHRSHLTCPRCGRESIKFDVYSTISVPLVEDKNRTNAIKLEDCIEKFMEGEQLDDLNAWYCPSCKKHVCALKMIALWSVPDVLILHLKRFQFDHCTVRNEVVRSKIDDTVVFPIDHLDLRQHVLGPIDENAPPIYKLFSVSEHMGPTANSGHYTATVRNSQDGRWYRYNDSHVGETTGDAAVTGGAYLLFYQRVKGNARWSGMEKVMKDKGIDPYGGLEADQDGFVKVKTKTKKKP